MANTKEEMIRERFMGYLPDVPVTEPPQVEEVEEIGESIDDVIDEDQEEVE